MTARRRWLYLGVASVLLVGGAMLVIALVGAPEAAAPVAERTFTENPYFTGSPDRPIDWGTALGWIGFFALIGGFLALSVWSQRRRRRGDEGTTYHAEGADAGMVHPPSTGSGSGA